MNREEQNDELIAPDALVKALQQSCDQAILVPPVVDEHVLDCASEHLARLRQRRARRSGAIAWAAAALLLLLGLLAYSLLPLRFRTLRADLNHDGQVNVLDALALAKQVQTGKPLPASLDLNGDGTVDQSDVAAIMKDVVAIHSDTRS